MTDDLVTRLRDGKLTWGDRWEAADRIEEQAATIARLTEQRNDQCRLKLEWVARAEAAEARVAALVAACEALREGYGASYIDEGTWEEVTALADAAIAAAKEGA